jgi:hypothetical protein
MCDQVDDEIPGRYIYQIASSACLANPLDSPFCAEPYCALDDVNFCPPIECQEMSTNDLVPTCKILEPNSKALQEIYDQREEE